eukprot:TRINITY_DN3732_c0_g1_i2.p1 TRINITY_DN3732_c0_g1~~TRINITY_DN3732_c0_g1_i2.p1  ORF type:complete len:363 (+),score=49.19 TRINITY_DN3732_c0_g1_i2:117-1205(+)
MGHTARVSTLCAFKPTTQDVGNASSGNLVDLVSGSHDHTLKLWSVEKRTLLGTLEGHRGNINDIHLCRSHSVVSVSSDQSLRVWNVKKETNTMTIPSIGKALCCAVSRNGDVIFVGGGNGAVALYDPRSSKLIKTCVHGSDSGDVTSCVASRTSDHRLFVGYRTGRLGVWDLRGLEEAEPALFADDMLTRARTNTVESESGGCEVAPEDADCAPSDDDTTDDIVVMNQFGGGAWGMPSYGGGGMFDNNVGSSSGLFDSSTTLGDGDGDGDANDGEDTVGDQQCYSKFASLHDSEISSMVLGGKYLYTGGHDGFIRKWCTETNTLISHFERPANRMYCLAFDASDRSVFFGCDEESLRSWADR